MKNDKPKFTPGPWRIEQVAIDTVTIAEATQKGRLVFSGTFRTPACAMGNAHLIAASPDLYAVLYALSYSITDDNSKGRCELSKRSNDALRAALEALAKARGES